MIEIRKAEAADADGILDCLRLAFEPYRAEYSPEGFADTTLNRQTLQRRLEEMTVLVARDEAGVIGTVAYNVPRPGEGHLRGMAVRPEAQRSGIAGQLLRTAEAQLKELGCRRVTLDTTAPLRRAIRFYERNGYCASGKVTDFFRMPLYEYVKLLK